MLQLNSSMLARAFLWFGLVCGLFAVLTQLSGKTFFASSFFYLQAGILGVLASIAVRMDKNK
ncbi:MAG: hypothetical protein H6760_01405 [Candidatus Nomurabacteria bacterium]|nr:MAG: hypothetical protein H6760_01405 [Candidatus Nomurabacteria bacterium]